MRWFIQKGDLDSFYHRILNNYTLTDLGLNTKIIYQQAIDDYKKNDFELKDHAVLLELSVNKDYADITSLSFRTMNRSYRINRRYFRVPFTGNVSDTVRPLINKMENNVLNIILSR